MQDLDSYELVMLFNRLAAQIHKSMDFNLKAYGLARTQYLVLAYLIEPGCLSTSELVGKLMVEPATLSGIIDTLERKGMVAREPHPTDKRRKDIRLTAVGKKIVESIPMPRRAVEVALKRGIDPTDIRKIVDVGEQMLKNLETDSGIKEEIKLA